MKTSSKSNISGIIGLYLSYSENKYSKRLNWRVTLPCGKTKAYSIYKYGLVESLKKALAERDAHCEQKVEHTLNFAYIIAYCKSKGLVVPGHWITELCQRQPDGVKVVNVDPGEASWV